MSGYSPELLQTLLESYILNDDNDDGDDVAGDDGVDDGEEECDLTEGQ